MCRNYGVSGIFGEPHVSKIMRVIVTPRIAFSVIHLAKSFRALFDNPKRRLSENLQGEPTLHTRDIEGAQNQCTVMSTQASYIYIYIYILAIVVIEAHI